MPLALLQGEVQVEEVDTASSCKDFTPVNQGRNRESAIMVTSLEQTHAAHQLWLCVPYPLFSLIQNSFLLITIIPKVLKHINRWASPAYKGPAGWLLWPCPTAADSSFSDKSNLAVTRGLASLKKILELIWPSEVSKCSLATLLQRCLCCHFLDVCNPASRGLALPGPTSQQWWRQRQKFNLRVKNVGDNHSQKMNNVTATTPHKHTKRGVIYRNF